MPDRIFSPDVHERPRERLARLGESALSDAELLALVLGTGTSREPVAMLAARLLDEVGGLPGLARTGLGDLARRPGVGVSRASRLVAALEVGRRFAARPLSLGVPIRSSQEVVGALGPRLADSDVEEVIAIALDVRNRPLGEVLVARGGLAHCPFAPADAFRALLRHAAAGAIFVHNHPSGEATPSASDHLVTERLRRAGELIGVPVLDHVIVARGGHFSFCDAGLLPRRDPVELDLNPRKALESGFRARGSGRLP